MLRKLFLVLSSIVLIGCSTEIDQTKPVEPIGDFGLGHNIVIAKNAIKGPFSRDGNLQHIEEQLKAELQVRLERYEGPRVYNVVTYVQAYVLAQPGVPMVFNPKSALILQITVWDDEKRIKLNDEPIQLTLLEFPNEKTAILGSGLGQDVQEQTQSLTKSVAVQIENWLRRQHKEHGWFDAAE